MVGEGRQKREGVPLFDQCPRAQPFGFLTVSNFDAEALVDLLELDGALGDSRLELGVGRPQRTFVFPKRTFSVDALGDVNGMSEDVRYSVRTMRQHVAIHPNPGRPRARDHAHQSGIATMLLQSSQIVVEEVPRVFCQELAQVAANALLGPIAK